MSLFTELNELMLKYRFRPEKRLGQHFITDESTIGKIVELAELEKSDKALEIGPGTGFLTCALAEKCSVTAIEKDEKMCDLLADRFGDSITLIRGDYLKEKIPAYDKCVSFPPYFASKKIVLKLLREKPKLCVLVFQAEFAEKLIAMPGFGEYGALGALAQYGYSIEIAARVSAKKFFPKPKSDSSIVVMRKISSKKAVKNEAGFAHFVEELFRHKNKNVSNALAGSKKFLPKRACLPKNFGEKALGRKLLEEKVNLLKVEDLVELYNSLCG